MTSTFDLEHYFNQSPDCLCIVGHDFLFRRVNPAFCHALGYSMEELMEIRVIDLLHVDDRGRIEKALERMKQNQTLTDFENRYLTKNGETRWFSWTAIPIEREQVFFGLAKDVTHRRKLDDDRNLLLSNMTKSVNELRQLTWATSHDLRSPVNNLLAVFSMLDITRVNDPETRRFLEMFKLATDNLRDTLDTYVDMLTEKDVLTSSVEQINLEEIMQSLIKSLSSLIEHTRTKINLDFSVFKYLTFNRVYMESIFLNLLTNSIKYAKPDHEPRISVYTRLQDGVKQLIFSDEGQGFDMEKVKDRVFGLHQKFHDHRDSKGIGLYLVHHHVTSMGGRIQLESAPGKGATFIISFD